MIIGDTEPPVGLGHLGDITIRLDYQHRLLDCLPHMGDCGERGGRQVTLFSPSNQSSCSWCSFCRIIVSESLQSSRSQDDLEVLERQSCFLRPGSLETPLVGHLQPGNSYFRAWILPPGMSAGRS